MPDGNFEGKNSRFWDSVILIRSFSPRVAKALVSSLLAMPMKMIQMPPLMHLKLLKTWMILRVLKGMKVTRKLNISPSKILTWKKNIPLLPVSFEWHKRFLNILLLKGTAISSYHHQGSTDRQQLDHGSTYFFQWGNVQRMLGPLWLCQWRNSKILVLCSDALGFGNVQD